MKIQLSGDKITVADLIKIGEFFREFFANRKDTLFINILEGTEDFTKEDVLGIFKKIFRGSKNYTQIIITRDKHETER